VGRKYILILGSVASGLRPIAEHIFSQLATNTMRQCHLKIPIQEYIFSQLATNSFFLKQRKHVLCLISIEVLSAIEELFVR